MAGKVRGACQLRGERDRSHGGLKIRRWPSSKCTTAAGASFYCTQKHLLKSFLEYGSYTRQEKRFGGEVVVKRPLIIHTVEPEIVMAEPGEFTRVVQKLTGLQAETGMALRSMKRKLMNGPGLMQSSKNTEMCAVGASTKSVNLGCTSSKRQPPPDSSDTEVQPSLPSPSSSLYPCTAVPSPRSGLTTSCSDQGYHTDISTESYDSHEPSIRASRGASSPSKYHCCADLHEQQGGDFLNEDEDGSSFFLFSLDCYYGNHAG